jgi:hypothetical protein
MESRKRLADLRGPQRRIGRLALFYKEAFVHVLFYRILIPIAILYAAAIVVYLAVPGLGVLAKAFTAVVWVLWTPQVFEVAKGLSLAATRGLAWGHLNEEFAALYRKRYPRATGPWVALPFLALAVWIAGFVVIVVRWTP